jgi:hypothetical protein
MRKGKVEMEYKIVMAGSGFIEIKGKILEGSELFEYRVNESIKDGWKPIGGVNCDGEVFYQAMVKESK